MKIIRYSGNVLHELGLHLLGGLVSWDKSLHRTSTRNYKTKVIDQNLQVEPNWFNTNS